MRKTVHMYRVEEERGADIRTLIRRAVEKHGSVADAAEEFGLTREGLYKWIRTLGGEVKTSSEVVFPEAVGARR